MAKTVADLHIGMRPSPIRDVHGYRISHVVGASIPNGEGEYTERTQLKGQKVRHNND